MAEFPVGVSRLKGQAIGISGLGNLLEEVNTHNLAG